MSVSAEVSNLADMVRAQAKALGDAVVYEFEGRQTSFAEFDRRTNRVANALKALGVKQGERIAYLGKNSDDFFELLLGAIKANVVMAPVNWRLAGPEVAFIVEDCKAPVLFVGPEFITLVKTIREQIPSVRTIITTEGGAPEWPDYAAWRDAQSADDPAVAITPNDIAIQLYTSGTTGKPKGAMLSHANFLNLVQTGDAAEKPDWNKWATSDVSLIAMPIFHIGGSGWGVMNLYHGAKGVIAREFDPTRILDFFEQYGITKLFMVPAAMQFVVRQPRARQVDFSRLKYMLYGASPIPAALLQGVHRRLQMRLRADVRHDRDHRHHRRTCRRRTMSKGWSACARPARPCPASSLRSSIMTATDCRRARSARSPPAPAPTWSATGTCRKRPPRTLGKDGWLRTGDAGYMDEDGYLYIHDRIKDMIISGGENIYPAEVESALCDHPDVAEVAVIGIPDEQWGEAVKAVVVHEAGQDGERHRHHRLHPHPHRRLQDAEERRLPRRPAAQSLGQDPAAESARSVLGGEGPAGELRRHCERSNRWRQDR